MLNFHLLSMSSSPLRLEHRSPLGKYDIQQPPPSLDIQKTDSKIQIKTTPAKINISRRETFASMGIYMPDQFREKVVSDAREKVRKAIDELVEDGNKFMDSRNDAITPIALRKSDGDPVQLEERHIPSVKPDISYDIAPPNISATEFVINFNWTVHTTANIQYQRENPQISVAQWHKLDIAYNGSISDVTKVGLDASQKVLIML